jgi:hypothetical protein
MPDTSSIGRRELITRMAGVAADVSLEHAFQDSRDIQNLHMDTNGWSDTGQQLTIGRGGFVMEGGNRSLEAIGADEVASALGLRAAERATGFQATDHPRPRSLGDHGPAVGRHEPRL